MQREEPRFGASESSDANVSRGDYRSFPTSQRCEPRHLVWKIALGVLLGNVLTAILGGILSLFLLGAVGAAFDQAMRDSKRQAYTPTKTNAQIVEEQRRFLETYAPSPAPLKADERCIKGERFRRESNGWTHLPNRPC